MLNLMQTVLKIKSIVIYHTEYKILFYNKVYNGDQKTKLIYIIFLNNFKIQIQFILEALLVPCIRNCYNGVQINAVISFFCFLSFFFLFIHYEVQIIF